MGRLRWSETLFDVTIRLGPPGPGGPGRTPSLEMELGGDDELRIPATMNYGRGDHSPLAGVPESEEPS